jgi:hypothetical protein
MRVCPCASQDKTAHRTSGEQGKNRKHCYTANGCRTLSSHSARRPEHVVMRILTAPWSSAMPVGSSAPADQECPSLTPPITPRPLTPGTPSLDTSLSSASPPIPCRFQQTSLEPVQPFPSISVAVHPMAVQSHSMPNVAGNHMFVGLHSAVPVQSDHILRPIIRQQRQRYAPYNK